MIAAVRHDVPMSIQEWKEWKKRQSLKDFALIWFNDTPKDRKYAYMLFFVVYALFVFLVSQLSSLLALLSVFFIVAMATGYARISVSMIRRDDRKASFTGLPVSIGIVPAPSNSKDRKRYAPEFKQQAVSLVMVQGMKICSAARELDIHPSVLSRWVNKAKSEMII